ncbi:MAG: LLM class flavin-dependent oxidoreductase [Alphaproteobacteria bacterium]|nr:LLM class flavin-dependent oxidoreductase [Alphaproteobacteria bacterium]MCB9930656.1 LLM class flavin-dependent oxidoreductase [Alphaproteobacteria bacterium]
MARELLINAFHMNCIGHQSPGLWTHPRDTSRHYNTLAYWVDLARTLERGLIDGIFLADVLGVYDVYAGTPDAALRAAIQVPVNDPCLLIPAMAMATEHLGFGVTCTLSFEPPYPFARRMTTLDHLTNGRIGWNIVTGYLNSAAQGMGQKQQTTHDLRYDMAADYMQVVYKLWEGSWEDGAVVQNRQTGVFADPAKVHRMRHDGPYYQLDAIHICEPSPQRTPVLYQAGASAKGREFGAAHAECLFIGGPSEKGTQSYVANMRERAVAVGRTADDLKIFSLATPIVGATRAEAEDKLAEYRRYVSSEGALALLSGWLGVDLSGLRPDDTLGDLSPEQLQTEGIQSALESLTKGVADTQWTVRQLAEYAGIGGRSPVFVGTGAEVAEQMIAWADTTGVDGFNLAYAIMPETFEDLVDSVVPELQSRGRFKTAYREGTLRDKLFGRPRLAAPHPAAAARIG